MKVFACSILAALSAAGAASAQTDELFVNGGSTMYRIQGGVVETSFGVPQHLFVANQTIQVGNSGGTGSEYDFDGNFLGNFNVANNGAHFDGTTDGTQYIYATQNFCGTGQMWRMDLNWQNPVNIFNYSPNGGCGIGVTYDTALDLLWTSSYSTNQIDAWDLNGNNIFSFGSGIGEPAGIAYETSTDTLWMPTGNGTLYQFAKNGTLLQSFNVGQSLGNTYSAEFAIPAPGAAALLGIAGLTAARRRRA